ncbi:MAG TPA: methylated-DNA--[protein]-cysteine S-methyltransferase [Candidatus Limnocylindrales bacterium]|nr:methylated-DNA--[protein]-cysteine S-methyltransferase [Candidatus Limnocylindrales bacterium]
MTHRIVIATLDGGGSPFRIGATERGIAAAGWDPDEAAFRADLTRRFGAPVTDLGDAAADEPAARILRASLPAFEALLRGEPGADLRIDIDLTDRPGWDQRVLDEVRTVTWGTTASYGDIARRVGAPRAARAVGGALGRNPISLMVPCHRIIAGDGTLGGYGGTGWVDRDRQLSRKEALLLQEGVTVRRRGG